MKKLQGFIIRQVVNSVLILLVGTALIRINKVSTELDKYCIQMPKQDLDEVRSKSKTMGDSNETHRNN